MQLIYQNKSIKIKECITFFDRFMGFMGKRNIQSGLLFNNCSSIHTFFMKENIDVIMCDKNNYILYFYSDLPKNKIILPKKGVRKVYETPSKYFDINMKTKDRKKMIIDEN